MQWANKLTFKAQVNDCLLISLLGAWWVTEAFIRVSKWFGKQFCCLEILKPSSFPTTYIYILIFSYFQWKNINCYIQNIFQYACVCTQSLQLCPTFCDPMDWSLPGPSVHGISQQEYWSGLPVISFSRGSSQPRDWTHVSCVSCIADVFFTAELPGKPIFQYSFMYLCGK